MRLKPTLAAVALAALSGCAPMQWIKADATPEALRQDLAQCSQDAWREARLRTWLYGPYNPILMTDPFGRRFLAWPYSRFGDPFGDPFIEQSRLEHFCMRSKGYDLVPVEPVQK